MITRTCWPTVTIDEIKSDDPGAVGIGPFGSRMKADRYVNHGVPVIRGQNITDSRSLMGDFVFVSDETAAELKSCLAYPGDLVFPHRGAIGEIGIVPAQLNGEPVSRFMLSTSLMKLTCNRDIADPVFVYYFFRSSLGRQEILKYTSTVGTPGIGQPLSSLRSMQLPLPPLVDQKRIAEVLGALDHKIDTCVLTNRLASDLISALFLRSIQAHGVQSRQLLDVIQFDFGEPFKGEYFNSRRKGRPLIRIRDLKTFDPQVWTTEQRNREVVIEPGDVLVGMDAEFRPTPWLGSCGVLNQRVCRARGIGVGRAFVCEALKAPLLEIERNKTGTTVIHLNQQDLGDAKIPLPSRATLEAFDSVAEPLFRLRIACAEEVRTLAGLRDTISPPLLSGELGIRGAESFVGDVA